jgi:hypothetical protein
MTTPITKELLTHFLDLGAAFASLVTAYGAFSGYRAQRIASESLVKTKQMAEEAAANFNPSISYSVKRDPVSGEIALKENPPKRVRTLDHAYTPPPKTSADIAKDQLRSRLEEVIAERERQQNSAKWNRRASNILTFGQYIVGAVLTTSLVQNGVSKTWLGILGLLVIICSAARQHFHPDQKAQESENTARTLRALIRFTQDQITILEAKSTNGEDRTDAFIQLLNEVTASINQIEAPEISSFPLKPIVLEVPKPQTPTS